MDDRCRTMIMDGLTVDERPLAVGYFVLDTLRSLFMTGINPDDCIHIKCGLIAPDELRRAEQDNETHIWLPPLKGIDDLSALYKLMVAVSRGDKSGSR